MDVIKQKSRLLIIGAGLIAVIALILVIGSSMSSKKDVSPGIGPGGFVIKQKKKESSWMGSFFNNLFGSAEDGDLSKGADDPKYAALVDKIDRLYSDFGMLPPDKQDEKKLIVDQASLVIDYQLGPGHPHKKEFLNIVGWSHDARQPLNKQFVEGKITRSELFRQLSHHFNDVSDRYAAIFSNEEYKSMFNLEKGESLAESMGLTKEMAEALDKQESNAGPIRDPLPADAFKMTESETMTKEQVDKFKKTYGDPPEYQAQPKESPDKLTK